MILACSRALYNPTPRGYHADVHPPLQPRTGRFHVGSLPLISASFFTTCLCLCVCLTAGCSGKQVHVTVENEFNMMAKRLAPVLKAHGVIDEHGAYVAPVFSTPELPPQLGEYLFQRLSPAFRFKVDPALLPPTFALSRTAGDTVEMQPYGFMLGQGRIS